MGEENDDNGMVSKAFHDKVVSELKAKMQKMDDARRKEVAELRARLVVKVEEEKQRVLCPICDKKLKYDGMTEDWVCPRDRWRGPRTAAIVED